jgi:hypothetical protein
MAPLKRLDEPPPVKEHPAIKAAYVELRRHTQASLDDSHSETLFDQACQLVRGSTGALPFSSPWDPGASLEFNKILLQLNPQRGEEAHAQISLGHSSRGHLAADDPRVERHQEILRHAAWLAHAPRRGFAALGRPPELQQLVAATCLDLYNCTACRNDWADLDDMHDSYKARLWMQLCPQLRMNALADVAIGLLCDRWVAGCHRVTTMISGCVGGAAPSSMLACVLLRQHQV